MWVLRSTARASPARPLAPGAAWPSSLSTVDGQFGCGERQALPHSSADGRDVLDEDAAAEDEEHREDHV